MNMADFGIFSEKFTQQLKEAITQFLSRHEALGDTDPLVQSIAERGWFINGSHTPAFTVRAFELVKKQHVRKLDNLFEEYYLEAIPEIEHRLRLAFPEIAPMVKQAFRCFREKLYYASVPLLLIISEHIANRGVSELTGRSERNLLFNFNRKHQRHNIAVAIGEMVTEYQTIYNIHRPLISEHLVNRHTKKLIPNSTSDFNRHQIIHGTSTDFGNRRSNLKAVCFVEFVAYSINDLRRDSI